MSRYWSCCWMVLIAGMLAGGCAGGPGHRQTAQKPREVSWPDGRDQAADSAGEKAAQAHAHYAAGVVHDMNDETEAALEDYYQAAMLDPDNQELVLEVSRRFIQSKQPDKAFEVLNRAVSRPGASAAVFARLGLVCLQLGKHEQAVSVDREAIKRAPRSLAGYQNLFLNYVQTKQTQQALQVLDEAAKAPGTDPEFLIGLSELYGSYVLQAPAQKEKIRPKALDVLNRAEKQSLSSASLRVRLAEGFDSFGASAKAALIYLDLLKALPDVPALRERVHARLASIFLQESDPKRAIEQLQALVHDDPTNPLPYYYLGYLAYNDKKPAEAVDHFAKAILLKPDFQEAYYDLALAQLALDKADDALGTLEKARKSFPKTFVMELYTGLAYNHKKAYRDAIRHYTEAEVIAKATDPSRLTQEFYFQVGAAYERAGDVPQSEEYFQKCLKLKPDFAEAQNYLGYMWAERGTNLDQARVLIEKAVKAEPKNAAYLDSLGWVLFKLKEPQQALGYILKAVELTDEPDATLYDHLGDVYAALHQPDKARDAWAKSLSVQPSEEVRKKLQSGLPTQPQRSVE